MKQYSLFGIKPDAFNPLQTRDENNKLRKALPENPYDFVELVKNKLKEKDLEIINEREYRLNYETSEKHYIEHKNNTNSNFTKDSFEGLLQFMISGKSYWIIFYGEDAIKKGRQILTDIRQEYLVNPKCRYNMTHAADSIESANREIMIHFPEITTKLNNNKTN
ncbi:MAG: nucleoside-diphosphate kinase [Candidatus Gracilibacteria bacterium]|nr:nucleoside-diphosphate kinase [Candidatus Gracilibacteria bacterium]